MGTLSKSRDRNYWQKCRRRSISGSKRLAFLRHVIDKRVILPPTNPGPELEDGMRLWRALLLTLMVACAARLQAGPHIIIHDPPASSIAPVGLNFTFTSDSSGGGVLGFTNTSGVDWFNLYVFVPPPQPLTSFTCGTDNLTFSTCTILAGQFGYFATVAFTGWAGDRERRYVLCRSRKQRVDSQRYVPGGCQLHPGAGNMALVERGNTVRSRAKEIFLTLIAG